MLRDALPKVFSVAFSAEDLETTTTAVALRCAVVNTEQETLQTANFTAPTLGVVRGQYRNTLKLEVFWIGDGSVESRIELNWVVIVQWFINTARKSEPLLHPIYLVRQGPYSTANSEIHPHILLYYA
jgi:hypothetical protein